MNAFVASELDIHGNVVSKRVVNSDRICSISVESASPSTARVFMKNGDAFTLPVEGRLKELIEGKWPPPPIPPKPYDAEIEYLEGTGTQYVDTELGYFPDFDIGCKMRESAGNVTVGINQEWTFSRNSPADPVWKLIVDGTTFRTGIPVTSYVDASYKNGSFVANSTVIASEPNQFVSGDMLVFTRGSSRPNAFPVILYYLKCYDSNGTLVRDFIPVRIGSVGYLYDRANPTGGPLGNGLYGSATDTPLIAGPDVAVT